MVARRKADGGEVGAVTVKELIETLKTLDPDAEAYVGAGAPYTVKKAGAPAPCWTSPPVQTKRTPETLVHKRCGKPAVGFNEHNGKRRHYCKRHVPGS